MLKWIYDLSYEELEKDIAHLYLPRFVADQVCRWLYEKNINDIACWSNISKKNRETLSQTYDIRLNKVLEVQADREGNRKYLIELKDKYKIEAVLIKEKKHFTMFISTQVGCALKCKFCATGRMGFKRNLSSGEILSQALLLKKDAAENSAPGQKEKINIVFMGMGEPLLNYENLSRALQLITSEKGIGISPRNITVSTAGILDGIKRLEKDFPRLKLSFSLNAPAAALREELMPISKKEKLDDILAYFRHTPRKHRVTFEYVLIKGVNDSLQDAEKTAALLRGIPCKINLIPYNPGGSGVNLESKVLLAAKRLNAPPREWGFETPAEPEVEAFCEYLHSRGYTVIIRWSKGREIKSACGQLATEI